MLFNSINFAFFLPVVFILYWFFTQKKLQLQNFLLLASSYFFYSCWDYRFLFLLIFSTLLDFFTGIKMFDSVNSKLRKFWFWFSILTNLGFLLVFKYYNFFIESFLELVKIFGLNPHIGTLSIILPVGISFYTFHGLSYVIDIYKNKITPERNFINYSVFVSFFPLLVAGPIERATHLLPQIKKRRIFSLHSASDGLRQILWGLFKKVVIADNCAEYANLIFNNSTEYSSEVLIIGALYFTFQIYGDFSGYSDIAIGTAKLFGIDLLRNFAFPYFSRDVAEFWRRWHISLSSWFRDYLYFPLGGSKGGPLLRVRNIFIIFLVSGFWHGANWTFIAWGGINALFILPSVILDTNRKNLDIVASGKFFPTLKELLSILLTFCLIVFTWIFFRAESLAHAFQYIHDIFNSTSNKMNLSFPLWLNLLIVIFMVIEWIGREQQFAISKIKLPRASRWFFYIILIILILCFAGEEQQFIYFQF